MADQMVAVLAVLRVCYLADSKVVLWAPQMAGSMAFQKVVLSAFQWVVGLAACWADELVAQLAALMADSTVHLTVVLLDPQ